MAQSVSFCLFLALSGFLWLTLRLAVRLFLALLALSGSLSGSLTLCLARCPALSGSLWLTLVLSGSLLLFKFAYKSHAWLTRALARLAVLLLRYSSVVTTLYHS